MASYDLEKCEIDYRDAYEVEIHLPNGDTLVLNRDEIKSLLTEWN